MKKASVLVVDDRHNWLDTADTLLSEEFDVELADSYDSAIAKLENKRPPFHVLISDIRLKDGDPGNTRGLDIVEYVQNLGSYTVPIVWTAFPAIETAKRAFRDLGVFDYIVKDPRDKGGKQIRFPIEEFRAKVREAANAAQQKQWENRILLVENDSKWQRKLSELIRESGYSTEVAESYDKAIEKIRKTEYRLLIVEIALEGKSVQDGLEFIRQVKTTRKVKATSPETQVIIVSDAGTMNTMRIAFTQLGVADFLPKTVEGGLVPADFKQAIHQVYISSREVFIVAKLENWPTEGLRVGQEYIFALCARKNVLRSDKVIASIWLPPSRENIEIEAILYIQDGDEYAEITPSSSQTWRIPTKGNIQDLHFGLIPKLPGNFTVQVELFGESGWWKSMEHTVSVQGG